MPYLREIDACRWYTNNGPLLKRFEEGLARHFAVEPDRVVAVANATAGLTLSLLAAAPPSKPATGFCVMPSWTHEATAVAVVRAGLTPWLHDVDETTWQLDPDRVAESIRLGPGPSPVTHIMVTAPFGATVDARRWAELAERTGVAVTVDAASGFDRLRGGPVTAVVSLHATKPLGIGEGGVVVARDAAQAARIRDLAQLGLRENRILPQAGMNAKLSEYGAAVGLAALSEWPERKALLASLRDRYALALNGQDRIRLWAPEGVSSTLMVRLAGFTAVEAADALKRQGIETRRWWHGGCHRQPAFADAPRQTLAVSEALADSVLGLPFHADLTMDEIDRVVAAALGIGQDDASPRLTARRSG